MLSGVWPASSMVRLMFLAHCPLTPDHCSLVGHIFCLFFSRCSKSLRTQAYPLTGLSPGRRFLACNRKDKSVELLVANQHSGDAGVLCFLLLCKRKIASGSPGESS